MGSRRDLHLTFHESRVPQAGPPLVDLLCGLFYGMLFTSISSSTFAGSSPSGNRGKVSGKRLSGLRRPCPASTFNRLPSFVVTFTQKRNCLSCPLLFMHSAVKSYRNELLFSPG